MALPGAAFGLDGVLYVSTEEYNASFGRQVVVAQSSDEGVTWRRLPPIPATTTGTATFSWITAGAPGHIGVIYYYSTDSGDPGIMTTSKWSAVWAESFNADGPTPTWTVTTVEDLVRTGAICIAAGCSGSNRFAGDFISAIIDQTGTAHLTWMRHDGGESPVVTSIRYQKFQPPSPSIYAAPPCGQLPLPVQLSSVVSRKIHGGVTFDVDLPVTGTHGIECRNGPATGQYSLIFTFLNPLHSVEGATVSSGTGTVSNSGVGSDTHQYIVNLTGVANAQHIFVTLHKVQDEAGRFSKVISAPMSVLIGDVNADSQVDSGDLILVKRQTLHPVNNNGGTSNFRDDVNADGNIDSGDLIIAKRQTLTGLPTPP